MRKKALLAILSALLIISTTASTVLASASVESADIDMTKQTSYSQQAEVHAEVETSLTVTVPKKIVLDALVNRMEFKVNAKGDLPGDKKVVVAPTVTKFNLESVGKQSVEATVNFPNTEWTHEDVAAKLSAIDLLVGTDHAGDIQFGILTAGKWRATFDFDISIVDVCDKADVNTDELERATFKYNDLKNAGVNMTGDVVIPYYAKLGDEYALVAYLDLNDATAEEKAAITGLTEEQPGQLYSLNGIEGTHIVELEYPKNVMMCNISNMPKLEKLVFSGKNYYFDGETPRQGFESTLPALKEIYILYDGASDFGQITGFVGLPNLEKVVIERGILNDTAVYDEYYISITEYAGCFSNCPKLTDVTLNYQDRRFENFNKYTDASDYIIDNRPFDNTPWKENLKNSSKPEPVDAGFVNIVGGGGVVTAIDNDYVLNNYKNNMGLLNYEEWQGSYVKVTEDNLVAAFRFGGGLADEGEAGTKLYKAHFVTDEKLSENAKIIQAEWGFAGYALFELQPYESGNCGLGYVITEDGFDIISTSSDSVSSRDFIIVDEGKIEITSDKMAANMKKFGIDGLKMTLDTYTVESAATAITHKGPLAIKGKEVYVDGVNKWLHKKIEAENCNSSNIISIIDSDQLINEYEDIVFSTVFFGNTQWQQVGLKRINIEAVDESEETVDKDIEIYVVDKYSEEVAKYENTMPVYDYTTMLNLMTSIDGTYIIICGK